MSSQSPTKSTSGRLVFSKNIRLNLNSKFIPEDFFPDSISQFCRSRKKSEKQNQSHVLRKSSSPSNANQDNFEFQKQAKNLEILRKRLIKIKQSSPPMNDNDSKKKISFKKRPVSKKGQRKLSQNVKNPQEVESGQKTKSKRCSKKLMDYMEKMKDVINIDIKFQQDIISPVYHKRSKQVAKQNSQQVETDDSPKTQRFRPKSQINSRQRLFSKQKVIGQTNKIVSRPLRIKIKEVSKIVRQSRQTKSKNERYKKFVDIQLNEEGMLTFYGSPNKNQRDSYDSRKYSTRASLPKLK